MSWLRNLLGAVPKEEMQGIFLDLSQPYWELEGPGTFPRLFHALFGWLPADAVLYFEGGYPDAEIASFLAGRAIPEQAHLAMGTIWPRPRVFHLPASHLADLAFLMEGHAEPELAVHFHVYHQGTVLLEWYDAFDGPMFLNGSTLEEQVKILSGRIGKSYRLIPSKN